MKQPPKLIPMEQVIDWLEQNQPDLEWEIDRAWIWLTTDLAPPHRKCECAQCQQRAAIRKAIGRDGPGFIYARNGHPLESGAVSHWGCHCNSPTPFRRRKKGPGSQAQASNETSESISDAELLAMVS